MADAKSNKGLRSRLISVPDIAVLLSFPFMFLTAWLVPPRYWHRIASLFAPIANMLALSPADNLRYMRKLMGDLLPHTTAEAVQTKCMAHFVANNLRTFWLYGHSNWEPRVEITGEQYLQDALERGRGVILWKWNGYFASLFFYMALQRSGYDVTVLSHPCHGYSNTAFGVRFLNPMQTRIEDRYIKARAVLGQDDPSRALMDLARELRGNGIVSIAAIAWSTDPVAAKFLADEIQLAPGAPYLASRTGAALLPVFPMQQELDHYVINIEPPIEFDPDVPLETQTATAVQEFATRQEKHVRAHPDQWHGWQEHRRR